MTLATGVETKMRVPSLSNATLVSLPDGVVVEAEYMMGKRAQEIVMTSIHWPIRLEVHVVYGLTYMMQIRNAIGEVCYWSYRNGTSSVSSGVSMGLDPPEEKFLEQSVQASLSVILFNSERLAKVITTPIIRVNWMVGGEKPVVHQLRYFWSKSFNMSTFAVDHDLAADLALGLAVRHEIVANEGLVFAVSRETTLLSMGCNDTTADPGSVSCGDANSSQDLSPST